MVIVDKCVGVEGIEPSHNGSKDRRLTTWLYSTKTREERGNRTPVTRFGV